MVDEIIRLQKAFNETISFKNADWFVNYNIPDDTTALVICGSDGIGVMFIVLQGNHVDDFQKVIDENKNFNPGIDGCLGECIRWACEHEDLIPLRCTIGGWGSKLKIR